MKKLMLSTALVLAAVLPSFAQTAQTQPFRTSVDAMEIYATSFIGKSVYVAEIPEVGDSVIGMQDGWENIGSVKDVILNRSGTVDAVLVDVGGFLGLGARTVAVNMSALRFVADEATPTDLGDFFLVMAGTRANIEAAPEYVPIAPMAAVATDPTPAPMATAPMSTTPMATVRDGYAAADAGYVTAERLMGASVFDAEDKDVGTVSEVLLASDGKLAQAVVDVGGFLGLGAKTVALQVLDLTILRKVDGDDLRIQVNMTKPQLEALPTFGN